MLCFALPCVAQDDASAALRASLERIRTLRAERPRDGLLAYHEALVRARLGEREAALDALRTLVGRRLGIVPIEGIGFEPLWNDPAFQALRAQLAEEEPATATAPVALRLDDAGLVPEGIAWDPATRRFFVGSIARRKIVVVDERGGPVRDFSLPTDGLDAVLGLAVDAGRRALWAVSTNGFLEEASSTRRNTVLRYDLSTGRLDARHDVPDALQLNDVSVAPDGTVYATDSAAGTVYRLARGTGGFVALGPPGSLRGANGIAATAEAVYVAISTGIARLDPAGGPAVRLPQPDDVVTGGIDGLYAYEGDLVGIQNVTNPGRVIRIRLADRGHRVAGVTVLQTHHHPAFAEPTTGAIAHGRLHVLANTYVSRYGPDGKVRDPETMTPTAIVAVPLQLDSGNSE